MTLSIKAYFVTLSITTICHYAECRDLFIVTLSVIMLNVVKLSAVAPFLSFQFAINLFHQKFKLNLKNLMARGKLTF
jgi:hypothetical protein